MPETEPNTVTGETTATVTVELTGTFSERGDAEKALRRRLRAAGFQVADEPPMRKWRCRWGGDDDMTINPDGVCDRHRAREAEYDAIMAAG